MDDCAAVVAEGSAATIFEHAGPGSRIGAVLVSRILNLSLRDVGHGEPCGADHASSCDSHGANVCTVESPAYGDHRNESTWLGQAR